MLHFRFLYVFCHVAFLSLDLCSLLSDICLFLTHFLLPVGFVSTTMTLFGLFAWLFRAMRIILLLLLFGWFLVFVVVVVIIIVMMNSFTRIEFLIEYIVKVVDLLHLLFRLFCIAIAIGMM